MKILLLDAQLFKNVEVEENMRTEDKIRTRNINYVVTVIITFEISRVANSNLFGFHP